MWFYPLSCFFFSFCFWVTSIWGIKIYWKLPPSPRRFVCPVTELSMRPQTEKPKPNSLASHVCPGEKRPNKKPPLNDSKTGGSWWWIANPKVHARIREMPKNDHTFASSLIFDPPNMGNLMIPAETLPTNQQKGSKWVVERSVCLKKYPQVQVGII